VVKIQPTLGQEKTKEFKKKLEILEKNRNKSSKDMLKKLKKKLKVADFIGNTKEELKGGMQSVFQIFQVIKLL
jgi:hypothetical protein